LFRQYSQDYGNGRVYIDYTADGDMAVVDSNSIYPFSWGVGTTLTCPVALRTNDHSWATGAVTAINFTGSSHDATVTIRTDAGLDINTNPAYCRQSPD